MNLAILCGSLEPGKDGVGDYARRLAEYCTGEKHRVLLISLNDTWVTGNSVHPGGHEIRLGAAQSWARRIAVLQEKLAAFRPDIVSLQFVPYGYHPRGFCHEFASRLAYLGRIYRWEIMFHELWLGLNPADSSKYKLTGWWQRHCVLRLVRHLSPVVVHTHAAAYDKFLNQEKIPSIRLPLFSNIEIVPASDDSGVYRMLAEAGSSLHPGHRDLTFVVLFFGSLHPEWQPDLLMQKLAGKKLCFVSLGRLGKVGSDKWCEFAGKYRDQAEFIALGEQSAERISAALQFADAGVAASPWNLIEKSGSVAAMIEHGLPVIVTRHDFLPAETLAPLQSAQLHPLWNDQFDLARLIKIAPSSRLPKIGGQFLADLQKELPAQAFAHDNNHGA